MKKKKAVVQLKKKSSTRQSNADSSKPVKVIAEMNIWEEPSTSEYVVLNEKNEFKAASLNKLVQELTSEKEFGKKTKKKNKTFDFF